VTRALMPYRHLTHVLLVEDDAGYTALVQAVLEAEWPDQLRLTVCATVGQAETRLAQSEAEIDCVVLDLRLPDSDGLDALHRLVSWPLRSRSSSSAGWAMREWRSTRFARVPRTS